MKNLVAIAVVSITTFAFSQNDDLQGHREFLLSNFDTAYWKDFCSSKDWHMRCVFVDMDGDQKDELITCTVTEEDRMGDCWSVWKRSQNGKMTRAIQTGDIVFNCPSWSFCKLGNKKGRFNVIGLGMCAESFCKSNGVKKTMPDCEFKFLTDGKYTLHQIEPDFDEVFRGDDICLVEHIYPEWYFGYDFNLPKITSRNPHTCKPPYTRPKGDLRIGGGICEPDGFVNFVNRYRMACKNKAAGEQNPVSVYVVFLDADNDGDADFYITSDLDKGESGDYDWNLYLQQDGSYILPKKIVWPVPERKDLCGLPSNVSASKMDFCRVLRLDVDPTFLIIDDDKKTQVRDAIMDNNTHRVEKLPCREYRENE